MDDVRHDQPGSLPIPATAAVARRMSEQKRQGTDPEVQLRRVLHGRGYRYRLQVRVPQRPRRTMDIAFPKERVAVFVDGCFWHACPEHATWPANNSSWWRSKLETNVKRDRDTDVALDEAGWLSVRVWEHSSAEAAADVVTAAVESRRAAL